MVSDVTIGILHSVPNHNIFYTVYITGNLPTTLGNLGLVTKLWASSCKIDGSIPDEFSGMTSLITLQIYGNMLTGMVVSKIASNGTCSFDSLILCTLCSWFSPC